MIVNDAFEGGGVKEQDPVVGSQEHSGSRAMIFEGGRRQDVCKDRTRKRGHVKCCDVMMIHRIRVV